MFEIMDSISELVYAADPETYELLYVNDSGKKIFQIENTENVKCYEAFQHRTSPCEFCTNKYLTEDKNYTWEFKNPVSGRLYLLKDRLVDWDGRTVRVEVAFDATDVAQEKQLLENSLRTQKTVMQCVQYMYETDDLGNGIENMLSLLGESLEAQRTYIFEIQDDRMSNTYEWCAPGVSPQKDNLKEMDTALIQRWVTYFDRKECVLIEDLEEIREISPIEYEILANQNIRSLVAAPVEKDGKLIGMIGVDNCHADKLFNVATLLTTLRYFLMTTLLRIEDEQKLKVLSYHDTLTGLYNRNRFLKDIEELQGWKSSVGIVYMDLNGLKGINDRGGHAAGDRALVACAEALVRVFPNAVHYRVGGDEFVTVRRGITKEQFDAQVAKLQQECCSNAVYKVALGARWSIVPENVDEMIRKADEDMYEDKRKFYRNNPRLNRFRAFEEETVLTKDNPLLQEYNMLMSSMNISVSKHLKRPDFHLIWANDFFYEMTGYTPEEFEDTFHGNCSVYFGELADEFAQLAQEVRNAFDSGKPGYEALIRMPRKNDSHMWINVVGTFTNEQIEGVPVVYTVLTNVTEFVQAQKEQTVTYDYLPGFVTKVRIGKDGLHLLYGNKQFNKFFGEKAEYEENGLLYANVEHNWETISRHYSSLRLGKPIAFEIEAEGRDGSNSYLKVSGECVDWYQGDPVYLAIFIDITESVKQRQELSIRAYIDPVTQGMNRAGFTEKAEESLANAKPYDYAFVSMDVQKFKVINDLFGIEAGDMTLRHIYNTMSGALAAGEYVTRVSADTFNLLLKLEEGVNLEERVCGFAEEVNAFNQSKEYSYLIGFTAGIYPIDDLSLAITQIRDRSNVARKQIKGIAGVELCSCKYYNNDDRLTLAREKEIENRMQKALENGEFVVYLQPKQNLNNSRIAGAEALVRWNDPVRGIIPPADFIPLFERNGFIVAMDLYVFEQVCKLIKKWTNEGKELFPISVNMSRAHLTDPDFLQRYETIREKHGVSANLLEIEVTETLIFENPVMLANIIDDIRGKGYRCSMDDFGSGYSSLNVLKNIRVDSLKLDRAFFSDRCAKDQRETDIIGIVVEMARRLSMTTVAEGVETQEQADFLKSVGCDILQGFLFSRPVPIQEFEEMAFK